MHVAQQMSATGQGAAGGAPCGTTNCRTQQLHTCRRLTCVHCRLMAFWRFGVVLFLRIATAINRSQPPTVTECAWLVEGVGSARAEGEGAQFACSWRWAVLYVLIAELKWSNNNVASVELTCHLTEP
jgi:hypothetical protein